MSDQVSDRDEAIFAGVQARAHVVGEWCAILVSQDEFAALCRVVFRESFQHLVSVETLWIDGRRIEPGIR